MSAPVNAATVREKLWDTFDSVRQHLEHQYDKVPYDLFSGLSVKELEDEIEEYLEAHSSEPRVIQKANIYRIVLSKGQISIDPLDWFADKLNHGGLLRKISERWQREVEAEDLPYHTSWLSRADRTGYLNAVLDLGHLSPGWSLLLEKGLPGLLSMAGEARKALGGEISREQSDFYDAVEIVYSATISFIERLSELAEKIKPEFPEHFERLTVVANALNNLCKNPPSSFHEALQLSYIMHQLIEMEGENVRSMSGFDHLFYPFYTADVDSGKITREQAKELFKFYCSKFFAHTKGVANGKNFYFGGQNPDGTSAVNDLTYLALEAYAELKTTDPKLSVRFYKDTPKEFLYFVSNIIRNGQTSFVLVNDEVAVPALLKRGKTLEEARSYLLIGCYEPAIEGKEIACNMSIKINLAKGIELVLNNGVDPLSGQILGPRTGNPLDFETFEEFFDAYIKQTDYQISHAMECVKALESYWPVINPSPLLAGTFADCLAKGKDVGQGGAKYNNTGCMGACLANAADSLLAVKKLVFEEKRCTMKELIGVLKKDFEGNEQLRQYILNRIPKWGNNNAEADEIGLRIVDFYTDKVNNTRNNRGGWFQASMFTLDYRFRFGKVSGALPDGRRSGVYLAPGLNAMTGMDKGGITGLINSTTKIDFTSIPNGSVVDINLHPTAVSGKEGLEALAALIDTFFAKGGFGLQFNIFDTKMLKDAQKNPEKYSTLQIRVTGWNVYFVSLSEFEQNQFIEENKHRI